MLKLKFKKKYLLAIFLCLSGVGIGILVQGQEGTSSTNDGVTIEEASCMTKEDEKRYLNITTAQENTSDGWKVTFSNLPSNAVVNLNGVEHTSTEGGNSSWTLSLNLDRAIDMIEPFIYPSYLKDESYLSNFSEEKKEACKSSGVEFLITQDVQVEQVYENNEKKQEILNMLPNGTDISFENNGISKEVSKDEIQKGIHLTCDYQPWIEENKASYRATTTVPGTNEYCNYECQEEVIVEYGPPIITAAGLGIEYEVTVSSKMDCKAKQTSTINWPTPKPVCVPTPSCNGGRFNDVNNEKAGPNEKFDQCIMSCDGGNYSQNCIDSCYQEVYGVTNSLPLAYGKPMNVQTFEVTHGMTRPNSQLGDNQNGGYYTGTLENSIWHSSVAGCDGTNANGNCAGFYYYTNDNKTSWTNSLLDFQNQYQGKKLRTYYVDAGGFVRGYSNNRLCTSICQWKGCEGTSGVDYYLSKKEAEDKYNQELNSIAGKIKSCYQDTPKIETKETVYTVTVSNAPQKDTTFKSNNTNYNGSMLQKDKDDSTKLTYRFPIAYLNKNNGAVSYQKNNKKDTQLGGNKFYTSLLSKNTNTPWYDIKLKYLEEGNTDLSSFNQNSIKYNINSTIENYGYLNWKFDIDCFYALKRNGNCINKEEDCDVVDENKPDYTQFIFRPISLTDVFPNNRNARWNWSCGATNVQNKNYPINPTTLTSNVETIGNDIYSSAKEDTYLDYDIILDKDTMRKIRDYNKVQKSYSDYSDMTCQKNEKGLTICQSGFLGNAKIFGDNVKKRGLVGCNNQSGVNSCDSSYYNSYTKECSDYLGR